MPRPAALAAAVLLCAAVVAGLHPLPADLGFRLAAPEQAIAVASEQALRAALSAADLGWSDRRVVQLTADISLSATVVISGPVRLQGNCAGAEGSRCALRGGGDDAHPVPLLHVTGPAAVVELANLELVGGVGAGSLAGALTASNHSLVDAVGVRLAGNTAASGGAARIDSHARLALTACELMDNSAQQAGGAVFVHSGSLHLDRTVVQGNTAVEGGGVCLAGGSRLTASRSRLGGNRLAGGSSDDAQLAAVSGADLLLADGDNSEANFEPLPPAGQLSVSGGQVRPFVRQAPSGGAAVDASHLHQVVGSAQQQRQQEQQQQPSGVAEQQQQQQQAQKKKPQPQKQLSEGERVVRLWIEEAARRLGDGTAEEAAEADSAGEEALEQQEEAEQPRRSRKLKQGRYEIVATTEKELAMALQDKERFIRLDAHIGLTGEFKSKESALPAVKASVTITGNCNDAIYAGRCLIDAKAISRIIHADNSGFFPSFFVTFENIRFTGGSAQGLGGAFFNSGKMQAEFKNCEFVGNSALNGAGAVSLQDGAIGLFSKTVFKGNSAAYGAGGAAYLTSNAGFTQCTFQDNSAPSGGAVAVGQSSSGIYFNGCTFNGNSAEVFGPDVYMESWVATPAYFNPYPVSAQVYPESTVAPYSAFRGWPAYPLLTSPPPSPPRPPRPPPPAPPSPPNPANWVYSEEGLWQALAAGNSSVTLGAHIQMTPGGRWWQGPPPSVIFPMTIIAQCKGFGSKCIVDLNGAPNPLFVIASNALLSVTNVRVLNGATMGNGAAAQITGPVRGVTFEFCDFMGNIATDAGAVEIRGASNVRFSNCQLGVNFADNMGGAVKTVGSNVTFLNTYFYQNRAMTGGALGMGPMSHIALANTTFSDNLATKSTPDGRWGDDIFIAAPAGSTLSLSKLPPESVAKIFPRASNTMLYTTPPPAPAPAPFASTPFMRPPFPAPLPQPPARVRQPPPRPPAPPPRPPPSPPAPPIDYLVKTLPILWGPVVLGGFLAVVLLFILLLACCHKRLLPKLEKPGELEARLAGEYEPSDSEEEAMSMADPVQSEIEVSMEGYYGTARFRRKAATAASTPREQPQQ